MTDFARDVTLLFSLSLSLSLHIHRHTAFTSYELCVERERGCFISSLHLHFSRGNFPFQQRARQREGPRATVCRRFRCRWSSCSSWQFFSFVEEEEGKAIKANKMQVCPVKEWRISLTHPAMGCQKEYVRVRRTTTRRPKLAKAIRAVRGKRVKTFFSLVLFYSLSSLFTQELRQIGPGSILCSNFFRTGSGSERQREGTGSICWLIHRSSKGAVKAGTETFNCRAKSLCQVGLVSFPFSLSLSLQLTEFNFQNTGHTGL